MAGSKVYFMDFHLDAETNFLGKFEKFLRKTGMDKIDFDRKYTAIKIHFGEYGNMAYLRPGYARTVAKIVRELGGIPYATDCNTLYAGMRNTPGKPPTSSRPNRSGTPCRERPPRPSCRPR